MKGGQEAEMTIENISLPIRQKPSLLVEQSGWLSKVLRISLFAFLTAVGAQVEIPVQPVPFTLQTIFVLLAGALLGPKEGFASMVLYITAGTLGAPVFAGFSAGWLVLFGPTGGYLWGFPLGAAVVGFLVHQKRKTSSEMPSLLFLVPAFFAGKVVIFALGILQLQWVLFHDWNKALQAGLYIFGLWGIVKLLVAVFTFRQSTGIFWRNTP